MDARAVMEEVFKRVVELKSQGWPDARIAHDLQSAGVPAELAEATIEMVNQEIGKARSKARVGRVLEIVGQQVAAAAIGAFSAWGFVALLERRGNLVDFNIGPINVVDSLLLTLLGSVAITALLAFFGLFKAYFD